MSDDDSLKCFVSHKCGEEAHALMARLSTALSRVQVTLLQDPFEPGHEIVTRIHTVAFHSFVFLSSPESWASNVCQEELSIARTRFIPVLTARLSGDLPNELKDRLYANLRGLTGAALEEALSSLAVIVSVRARLYDKIMTLAPQNNPEETTKAAQSIVDDVDPTLIAESLDHIASFYDPDANPTTRFWLALAVGKAGTCRAKELLKRFSWENHPYPREGIRQANEMLGQLRCKEAIL